MPSTCLRKQESGGARRTLPGCRGHTDDDRNRQGVIAFRTTPWKRLRNGSIVAGCPLARHAPDGLGPKSEAPGRRSSLRPHRPLPHGIHPHPRRTHAQPQERQPRPSPPPADRRHRAVGIGQEFARVRHALRGGAAKVRRVAFGVCAAVPAADGKAGRRPDRRPLAGDLDRAEGDVAQPALDRRHRHRDPRLPAAAVRAGRRPVLPRPSRAAPCGDDHLADGRRDAGAPRGHAADDRRAGGRQPEGRAAGAVRRAARQGLRPRACRRQGVRDRRRAPARQEHQAHRRRRHRQAPHSRGPEAAPRRIVRDRAAQRRRPRGRRRNGHRQGAPVLGEVCLPDLQLFARRARAAPVFLQQPDGRVPALRRTRRDQLLRSQARGCLPSALARVGNDQGLGPAQPVLPPDAAGARETRRLRPRAAVRAAARARPAARALRQRRRQDPVHLPVRPRQADGARAHLRGNHPEPRTPLSRDRFADGPRGARQVPQLEALPGMRRHPAAARGPERQGRHRRGRARDLRGLGAPAQGRLGLLRRAQARWAEARDRRPHHQGDREPPRVPEQRRPRLPVARPVGGDAVGRRGAADPPRVADRLGADRRHVRAGRALDWAASARQRPAARHAEAPARPRQQRDRRRARPRRDSGCGLYRRHGSRRRRARRPGGRAGNSRGDPPRAAFADRPIPRRASPHTDARAPPPLRPRSAC